MVIVLKKLKSSYRFADTSYNRLAEDGLDTVYVHKTEKRKVVAKFNSADFYDEGTAIMKEILEQYGLYPTHDKKRKDATTIFIFPATKEGRQNAQKASDILRKIKGDEINEASYKTTTSPYSIITKNGLNFTIKDASSINQLVEVTDPETGETSTVFQLTDYSKNQSVKKAQEEAESKSTILTIAIIAIVVIIVLVLLAMLIKKRKSA